MAILVTAYLYSPGRTPSERLIFNPLAVESFQLAEAGVLRLIMSSGVEHVVYDRDPYDLLSIGEQIEKAHSYA
jgi:hypothetical protein